jgi:hypothetical protein
MATWDQVRQNPTLYPHALLPGEGERLQWHDDAHRPHSSQVFCVSAFGTLRHFSVRDQVICQLLAPREASATSDATWTIELEAVRPDLLSEYGGVQASSVDALLLNLRAVYCIGSKFWKDAEDGFGGCSQPKPDKRGAVKCAGYYGPGSDLKTRTNAWCRGAMWRPSVVC